MKLMRRISDKTRYSCDGLAKQGLDITYVKNNKLQKSNWDEAISILVEKIKLLILMK